MRTYTAPRYDTDETGEHRVGQGEPVGHPEEECSDYDGRRGRHPALEAGLDHSAEQDLFRHAGRERQEHDPADGRLPEVRAEMVFHGGDQPADRPPRRAETPAQQEQHRDGREQTVQNRSGIEPQPIERRDVEIPRDGQRGGEEGDLRRNAGDQ